MATRAAIASADRASREKIADKQLKQEKDIAQKKLALDKKKTDREHYHNSIKEATKIASLINDPEWYKKYNVAEASAKVPSFFRTGIPLESGWLHDADTWASYPVYDNLPGVLTFLYLPVLPNNFTGTLPGDKDYRYSPINTILTRFMAELRKLNSRIGDYDPADMGLYMLGVSDIMEDLLHLRKALKVYNTWYAENANFCDVMLKACGFDPSDFKTYYVQYRLFYEKAVQQFNANAVLPSSIALFKRRAWIASVIVRDHEGPTSQLYTFVKGISYTLTDGETGLQGVKSDGERMFASFTASINTKMEAIFNSVGMVTITADLRAAFPQNSLLQVPIDYDTPVEYSDSITDKEQIHNLQTLPCKSSNWMVTGVKPNDITDMSIVQDSVGYLGQGAISGGNLIPLHMVMTNFNAMEIKGIDDYSLVRGALPRWYNFYKADPVNEDDILEGSRLRVRLNKMTIGGVGSWYPQYCGTEIIQYGKVWIRDASNNNISFFGFTTDHVGTDAAGTSTPKIAFLSRFDWLPIYRIIGSQTAEDVYYGNYFTIGEIDHAVSESNQTLKLLHESCALSLLWLDSNEFSFVKH